MGRRGDTSLILVVHVTGYSILLHHLPNFSVAWFLVAVPVELVVVAVIVKLWLNILPQKVKM